MKTVFVGGSIYSFSRIISFLYFMFSPHWHVSLKCPFPAAVSLTAGQVPGTAPAGSLRLQHGPGADTARSNATAGASRQLPPHSAHKQLTLLLFSVHRATVASNWSAWVNLKARRLTQCPARTFPADLFQKHRQLLWLHRGNSIRSSRQPGALS